MNRSKGSRHQTNPLFVCRGCLLGSVKRNGTISRGHWSSSAVTFGWVFYDIFVKSCPSLSSKCLPVSYKNTCLQWCRDKIWCSKVCRMLCYIFAGGNQQMLNFMFYCTMWYLYKKEILGHRGEYYCKRLVSSNTKHPKSTTYFLVKLQPYYALCSNLPPWSYNI